MIRRAARFLVPVPAEVLVDQADGVDHHVLRARPVHHLADAHLARRVIAVGEHEHDLPSVHRLQPFEALVDRIIEAGWITEVQLVLQQVHEPIAIVDEIPRMELDFVAELPDLCLVVGQEAQQELLRAVLHQTERRGHAAARVDHHRGRDRRRLVLEDVDRLRLSVVEDLEVLLRQVGDEALFGIGDRHVDRDRFRGDLDLLRRDGRGEDQGDEDGCTPAHGYS